MGKIVINASSSSAGGGLTYLRNVLPRLADRPAGGHSYIVWIPPQHSAEFSKYQTESLIVKTTPFPKGLVARFWWEQWELRRYLKKEGALALVSLGNFAMLAAPAPQVLFCRNALYFSGVFCLDLLKRREMGKLFRYLLLGLVSRMSIRLADVNIAPTQAFADRIRASYGLKKVVISVLPFGVNGDWLTNSSTVSRKCANGCHVLLYVSHYNYFRNFETLLKALPIINTALLNRTGGKAQLVLTTRIERGRFYGGYDASRASELIDRLAIRKDIAMFGEVPYNELPALYHSCDLFVCPSYAESFGHSLLEAMALELPVVAADLPVQREVCGDAALYFKVFDAEHLAEQCVKVLTDEKLKNELKERGRWQCQKFSWDNHVAGLLALIEECAGKAIRTSNSRSE